MAVVPQRRQKRVSGIEGALEAYDKALALRPDFEFARLSRGQIRLARGDIPGALEDLRKAVALISDEDTRLNVARDALRRAEAAAAKPGRSR